jgi:predicted DNA-binding protein
MVSKPLGPRVPEEIERYLKEFMKVEGVDKSTAVRKILERGISEWRKERAVELLGRGKITFTRLLRWRAFLGDARFGEGSKKLRFAHPECHISGCNPR